VHIEAKMNVDGSVRRCIVRDLSPSGARIAVDAPKDIPDHFLICMSPRGFPIEKAKVIWRSDCELGVEFEAQEQTEAMTTADAGPESLRLGPSRRWRE
jgi:hypothetical protein